MGARPISVAITPDGLADAVTKDDNGKSWFVEPCVEKMPMSEFLGKLEDPNSKEIHYLQSQNGNLYSNAYFDGDPSASEFDPLRPLVPPEIEWCSEALDRRPDAVNLWIGTGASVTSIHSDPYENVYHVVRGSKTFTLLPPTEGWCLRERLYPHATYTRASPLNPTSASTLELTPSPPGTCPPVHWSSITHPHLPSFSSISTSSTTSSNNHVWSTNNTNTAAATETETEIRTLPPTAHPLSITVHAGETLYLPAGWWHHVRQSVHDCDDFLVADESERKGESEITVALNWWYDIEGRGASWVWLGLLRGGGEVPWADEGADEKKHGVKEDR